MSTTMRKCRFPEGFESPKRTVGIGWRAVANRIWDVPNYNGKFPQHPQRNGGGLGMEAGRQAIGLGLEPILFTATGNDAAGNALRQELAATGATLDGVQVASGSTTKAEVVTCNGDRAVLIDEGERGIEWQPSARDWLLMRNVDAFCFGGSLPDTVVDAVCDKARRLGKPAFANPTRFGNAVGRNLEGVCILQVSREDVSNFGLALNAPATEIAEFFLELGCCAVVVTESEHGQRGFDQGSKSVWMPAIPGRVAKFPTGCGDVAFMAHIAGYLAGLSMYDWLNAGSVAGAFFVEHGYPGARADLVRLAQEWPPERRV